MVARKSATSTNETPVRFYKVVALSFLGLTVALLAVIVFLSSKRATIAIVTRPDPIEVNTRVLVNGPESNTSIAGTVASFVVDFTDTFSPTGNREEPGIAIGKITITNDSTLDQPLVATTRFLSSDGVLFRLKNYTVVSKQGSIEAAVYADKEGAEGNIGPSKFTIPGLSESRQTQVYGTSAASMTGGIKTIGTLSADDVSRAKQVLLADMLDQGKAALSEKYLGKTGVFSTVQEVITLSKDTEVGDEVSAFTLVGKATIVGIFYDAAELSVLGEAMLSARAIDDAEQVQPSGDDPTVTLGTYDATAGTAALDVFFRGLATINPESKQLNKIMFYGKTRDEVRRYLLTLDHVYGVDVTFHPAWTQTVPHVAEHVDVVVKKVE